MGLGLFGCATSSTPPTSPEQNLYCSVYSLNIDGEPSGTAFAIVSDGVVSLLTAAHVVLSNEQHSITLKSPCHRESLNINKVAIMPGQDMAVLFTNTPLRSGFSIRTRDAQFGEFIESPNYSGLGKASSKFAAKSIPSSGRVIGYDDSSILITLDVLYKGGSGAPILDGNKGVVGLLSNRVNFEGGYSGVSFGIDAKTIQSSLKQFYDSLR
jgi:hypothetical protein